MNNVLCFHLKWVSHNHWCSRLHVKERMIPSTQQQNCAEILFYFCFCLELDGCIVEFSQMGRYSQRWIFFFGAAAFFFCFSNGIHNRMLQRHVGCCWRRMQLETEYKTSEEGKKKKKGSKTCIHLGKNEFGSIWTNYFRTMCSRNFRKKKTKPRRKIVAVIVMTPRANRLKRLDSFFSWASNPKIDQSPQMGFEVPGSQSNKRGDQKTNPMALHFIGLVMGRSIEQW